LLIDVLMVEEVVGGEYARAELLGEGEYCNVEELGGGGRD